MRRPSLLFAVCLSTLLPGCWKNEARWEAENAGRASVARPGESEAERLYRHGRDCMDVLERNDCALDYFEQLIALQPDRRDLVGDATFRLVQLYRRDNQPERAKLLLRQFWDLGMDYGSAGVVPYGVRFAPTELTSLYMVDVDRLEASGFHQSLPDDVKDTMFTCDEARREDLRAQAEARAEARRQARLEAMSPEERTEYERSQAQREARAERLRGDGDGDARVPAIYEQGFCQLARALGVADPRDFSRFVGGRNHERAQQSVAVVRIDDLEAKLAAAVESGALISEPTPALDGVSLESMTEGQRARLRLWTLADVDYEGGKAQLMSFDTDELTLAPEALAVDMLQARAGERDRMNPALRTLLRQVPADVAFMTVVTPEAMSGFVDQAGAMANLLPDPDGLMMAAVVYDYAGMFIRVPTEDAVKSWLLLTIARRLIEGTKEDAARDPEMAGREILRDLDISQSPDGKALLMSVILTRGAVMEMFLD